MKNPASEMARIVVLSGGVGGAKFASGLNDLLDAGDLAIVVNTADDFDHLGLHICPDLDSVLYALANRQDEKRGWGRRDESWNCLSALSELGADDWFALGDRDLAVHLYRSELLRQGMSLGEITLRLAKALGVHSAIIPMTESKVSTVLSTDLGELFLQDYFVRHRSKPKVFGLRYEGAQNASAHPSFKQALTSQRLQAIFIAPSNPFISIDPILEIPGVRAMLRECAAPVIAVSPLIGGQAVKGPLGEMLDSLGLKRSSSTIAAHYEGLIDGLIIDAADAKEAAAINLPIIATPTLMSDAASRKALAQAALKFASELSRA